MLALEGADAWAVNWDSSKQVLEVLRERDLELTDTDEGTLAAHAERDPMIPTLLEYREAARRTTTYGSDFLALVHPVTGRIHPDWFQLGSEAGRMSCKKPNLQQIPRETAYRACFRASEGRVLVKCDYSQIELRIAAEIAGDERMIAAYAAGQDLHTLTARTVLGREQVAKSDRQASKAINFGITYGMGARRLRLNALTNNGVELSEEDAERFRERFFETYPGLRAWHRRQPDHAIATRTLGGRRRLNIKRFTDKLNSPVQGTGADMLKAAMGRLFETRRQVPGSRLVLAVHDELVVEVRESLAEEAKAWLERCMRDAGQELLKKVPVEVEGQVARTWAGDDAGGAEARAEAA
ncbi:MAG: DNA polymerase [Candidatus Dormibacteraeota bacterium]|nr:DNA polymerase [Candidatus Dormibacteraeota bacterium]